MEDIKYKGIRAEKGCGTVWITGYLYVNKDEYYIVPWKNAFIPANHMFLVDKDTITIMEEQNSNEN